MLRPETFHLLVLQPPVIVRCTFNSLVLLKSQTKPTPLRPRSFRPKIIDLPRSSISRNCNEFHSTLLSHHDSRQILGLKKVGVLIVRRQLFLSSTLPVLNLNQICIWRGLRGEIRTDILIEAHFSGGI